MLSLHTLGQRAGTPRIWIENHRLGTLGFTPGARFDIRQRSASSIAIELNVAGSNTIPVVTGSPSDFQLLNNMTNTGIENDIRNADVLIDKRDRRMEIIDGALNALAPSFGTAREFSDEQREACKLGLGLLKLSLQTLDSFGVAHGKTSSVNAEHEPRGQKGNHA